MKRIIEKEIMEDMAQAVAYAKADFSDSEKLFVDSFAIDFGLRVSNIIDLGCGPGSATIRFAKTLPIISVTGVDASKPMLILAAKAIKKNRIEDRIRLVYGRIPGLRFDTHFDAIVSKDLLHHLEDAAVFWDQVISLCRDEIIVFVMDLVRPDSKKKAKEIVESIAGDQAPVLKEDFYNSLCAAFTIQEIEEQLAIARLPLSVSPIGDRHFLVKGIIRRR